MDFAFDFPSVKYAVLLYTALAGFLLWADRDRILLLLASGDQVRAARAAVAATPATTTAPPARRLSTPARAAIAFGTAVLALFAAHIVGTALSPGPEAAARELLESRVAASDRVELKSSRYTGKWGFGREAVIEFVVANGAGERVVRMFATKANGFVGWEILPDSTRR